MPQDRDFGMTYSPCHTAGNWRRRMKEDWQTGYVETNGLRLHYTRTGGDKPPLVLAHGVTDAGPCWTPVAQALAAEYDTIMVDARGHGHSDAPERGYDPAEQADDLARVITALDLERPAVLGHSRWARPRRWSSPASIQTCPGQFCWKTPRRGGRVGPPRRRRPSAWRGCGNG